MLIFIVTLGCAFVFAVCTFLLVSHFKHRRTVVEHDALRELFWQRRSRIPLLIEVIKRNEAGDTTSISKLIATRSEISALSGKTVPLSEEAKKEMLLTSLIHDVLAKSRQHRALQGDSLFLSLEKEFAEAAKSIEALQKRLQDTAPKHRIKT